MAEIFILITFLLLMTFASILNRKDVKIAELTNQVQLIEKGSEATKKMLQIVAAAPDLDKELVAAAESTSENVAYIDSNQLRENGETTQAVISKALAEYKAAKDLTASTTDGSVDNDLAKMSREEIQQELANLRGQNKNLVSQMKSEGRSVDLPPCWPSATNGWKDEIFRIELNNGGMRIFDTTPASRLAEKAKLPLGDIKYGATLSEGAFISEVSALGAWSQQHQCRFLVSIADAVTGGEGAKDLYKHRLGTVENYFYKRLIRTPFLEATPTDTEMAPAAPVAEPVDERAPAAPSLIDRLFSGKHEAKEGFN
jgi:competence protein ComGC